MSHPLAACEESTVPTPRHELIRCRIALGLNQREAAAAAGVSRNALVNAEDGGRVKLPTAHKLAEHYGRPMLELFPEADGRLTLVVPVHEVPQ
jgi:DNA-binding XRE family transcriptional regulator